ncbi:MAG: nucleotide exchange factor GrpE [Ardenticatenaceae bacterium]|nr:nucleotide exchange factor GrpE [Ardenticatenaceae bacterium]
MFRDYDDYRRRYGRSRPVTEIPGRSAQQNSAAEWRETAEKWYNAAKQQQTEVKRLENELAAAQRQLAAYQEELTNAQTKTASAPPDKAGEDWHEKYLRQAAEFENSKKRLEQRYATEAQQNQEKLLRDMLPLADNLDRALSHQEGPDDAGLALIRKAFLATLADYGVKPIVAEGRPFDPELHEAVGVLPAPRTASGTVIAVEQTGYTYQDKLLRPARVLVAE